MKNCDVCGRIIPHPDINILGICDGHNIASRGM